MRVIKPPTSLDTIDPRHVLVFLAGSIECDEAPNWQQKIENRLSGLDKVTLANPRREDWDESWVQSIHNPQFREQVSWELSAQEMADCIGMWFEPGTKSPITLLELGLLVETGRLIVGCSEGFWRKGNVDIVCARNHVRVYNTFSEFGSAVEDVVIGLIQQD